MKMKIARMTRGEWGSLRAFFDVETDEGFVIKGLKIVQGQDGLSCQQLRHEVPNIPNQHTTKIAWCSRSRH